MTKKTVIVSDGDDEDDHGNDAVDITRKKIDNFCEEEPHVKGRKTLKERGLDIPKGAINKFKWDEQDG